MASELTKAIQLNYRKPKSLQVVYWDEMFFGFRVTQCRDSLISSLRNALPSVPADRQWQLGEMLARYLANQGATDEAIEEYRRCLTGGHLAARDEARLRGSLAELLYQKGDKKSALAEYRQAFLLDPGNPDFKQAYDKVLNELNSH